ncbi:unnamed protein product [Paramecium sonneborni]|uniref:Uncharacterized protein n=1 Tax=Paramecium sonneborni TaxID=65129 RepID=A0A8S1MLY6_9CILI|nr:unnamed protein product [Paramecium sonneborni]
MASNLNEPFIVYKNYRQQQKVIKKECLKEKIITKGEIKKKIEKSKKNTSQQPTQKMMFDQNLIFKVFQHYKQQQQMLQQLYHDQRMNTNALDDIDIDEFSPIYKFGIPTTPQNVALQRRMSRDDEDVKI